MIDTNKVTRMIHRNERIIRHKVGLLTLATELGNVTEAYQTTMDVSRDYGTGRATDGSGRMMVSALSQQKKNLKPCPESVGHYTASTFKPSQPPEYFTLHGPGFGFTHNTLSFKSEQSRPSN
ncbi:hypothetical protein [Oceanobacter sp. 1_MG-2023]|uniref:hypothetical protein n=1 Tax=unclassified Oceanobacter TaxID=2620260 RepID=UPI00351E04B4